MQTLIVIPTYNEAKNLPELAQQLFALPLLDVHVLVVDDNSPDGTANVAEDLNQLYRGRVHVLRRKAKEGLGRAYVAGFKEALHLAPTYVVQMDADLSHPPASVPDLLDALKDSDVAVGSRYIRGGGVAQGWGFGRQLMSRGGDAYVRMVLGLPVHDTKSGFKAYRRQVLEAIDLDAITSHGYIFQAEIIYRCYKMGYRITEVPFTFYERKAGKSKMSFGIIIEALWRSLWLRFHSKRIQPRAIV